MEEGKSKVRSLTVLRSAVVDGHLSLFAKESGDSPSPDAKLVEIDLGDSERCPRALASVVAMAAKGDRLTLLFDGVDLKGVSLSGVEDGLVVGQIAQGAPMPGAVAVPPLPTLEKLDEPKPVGLALPGLDAASLSTLSGTFLELEGHALGAHVSSTVAGMLGQAKGRLLRGERLSEDELAFAAADSLGHMLRNAEPAVVGVACGMLRQEVSWLSQAQWREVFAIAKNPLHVGARARMQESLLGSTHGSQPAPGAAKP